MTLIFKQLSHKSLSFILLFSFPWRYFFEREPIHSSIFWWHKTKALTISPKFSRFWTTCIKKMRYPCSSMYSQNRVESSYQTDAFGQWNGYHQPRLANTHSLLFHLSVLWQHCLLSVQCVRPENQTVQHLLLSLHIELVVRLLDVFRAIGLWSFCQQFLWYRYRLIFSHPKSQESLAAKKSVLTKIIIYTQVAKYF